MSEESERFYTINLGKVLLSQSQHRAVRAINMIKEFARQHMKVETVKIDEDLAREVWAKGVRSPPRKIRVRMSKTDEGYVLVSQHDDIDFFASEQDEEIEYDASSEDEDSEIEDKTELGMEDPKVEEPIEDPEEEKDELVGNEPEKESLEEKPAEADDEETLKDVKEPEKDEPVKEEPKKE